MASEFFRALIGPDIVAVYGFGPDALWVIFTFIMAVGIAIFMQQRVDNKDAGIFTFLAFLIVGVFLGMVDFLVVSIPLVLTGFIYWGTRGKGT